MPTCLLDDRMRGSLRGVLASTALALSLGGAPAQTATAPKPFDDVLHTLHLKARTVPAPDFVVRSRPAAADMSYVPVGRTHPERSDKVMSPADVAATEAELDAARVTQQRRAGVRPPVVPLKNRTKAPSPGATLR